MRIEIFAHKVTEILLADGWHEIADFKVESYVIVSPDRVIGASSDGTGFTCRDADGYIHGPLTSILALRTTA